MIDLLSDEILLKETRRFTKEIELVEKDMVKIIDPEDQKKCC